MNTRQTVTISLPPELVREMERVRRTPRRTRSELIKEALRVYLREQVLVRKASPSERRALAKGRAEFRRGAYITLDELQYALGSPRRPISRKTA